MSSVSLQQLRVQIFREDYQTIAFIRRQEPNSLVARSFAPGLVEVIVVDLGNAGEKLLTREQRKAFKLSDNALFQLGRRQSATAAEGTIQSGMIAGCVQMISCNGFFLSGTLLYTLPQQLYSYGLFVAPISWHHWCVHTIMPASTTPDLPALMERIAADIYTDMQATDAERLGRTLFWWRPDDRLTLVKFIGHGENRQVDPNSNLASVLASCSR